MLPGWVTKSTTIWKAVALVVGFFTVPVRLFHEPEAMAQVPTMTSARELRAWVKGTMLPGVTVTAFADDDAGDEEQEQTRTATSAQAAASGTLRRATESVRGPQLGR